MTNSSNSASNLEKGKFKITKSGVIIKSTSDDLLDNLDLEKKIIDRNKLAEEISKNRFVNGEKHINNGVPKGEIQIGSKLLIIDENKYSDILLEYKKTLDDKPSNYEKRLEELDSILAEIIILDSNNMIEFQSIDNFHGNKNSKIEADIAYTELNKNPIYKDKISLISKKNDDTEDYFIIKWTDEEIQKINNGQEKKDIVDLEKEELIKKIKELEEKNNNLLEENKILKDKLASIEERIKKLEEKKDNKEEKEKKEDVEKVNEVTRDLDNKDINYKKQLKAKVENMRIGGTLILVKGSSQIAKMIKLDDKGFQCKNSTDTEFQKLIDKDHYIIENGNKVNISYVSNEDLRKFINFEEEITPKPIPTPTPEPTPDPENTKDLELSAVISDMGTDVHRERVSLETEEELRDEYKNTGKWNMPKRAYLFLSRGAKRKRLIKEKMEKLEKKKHAFTKNEPFDQEIESAADRHEIEKGKYNLASIDKKVEKIDDPKVNEICKKYLESDGITLIYTDDNFKDDFNAITADKNTILGKALEGQKEIKYIGSNILEKLKLKKAAFELDNEINQELSKYINTSDEIHIKNIEEKISKYIAKHQENPEYIAIYTKILEEKDPSKLKQFLKHQGAIMKMKVNNLKMTIDILTAGKSAYQIDNKDRQKGRAYKVGHALDKLPRWVQTAGFVGLSIGTGLLTGGLGTVASAAIVTGVSASSVGGLNALKKWTHYTKEQNTHEKNVATDYRNEQKKIQERQDQALKGKRYSWKTYKAKRQLALYDQSTQENFQISNTITDTITDLCSKISKLTPQEENYIKKNLIQGKVRLDYYRDIGHNFLASNEKDKIEKDMKRLEKAIILGTAKLGISLADITSLQATDDTGTNLKYENIKKDLENSYNKSLIQFKRERRVLAAKYGVGTAIASAGMSLGMQYLMGTGVFSDKVVPGSTTGVGTSENFNPGKHNLLDTGTSNSIHDTAQSISSNPNINSSSVIDINYGAGTDATAVIPGRLTQSVYDTKINEVINNINSMKGLDTTIRDQLIDHVKSQPRKSSRATSNFTNDFLHGMRCAETVEQAARGLADSGYNHGINITYNSSYDIVGKGIHNVAERVVNADFILNNPGTGNSRWERLVIPVPLFFNTFKDKILGKTPQDKKPEDSNDKTDKPKGKEDDDIEVGDINPYKPDPVDPTKDPDGFYKDDIGSKKNDDSFKGKTKKITTRGQKIDQIDKSDYGKEYPGDGKLQSEKTTAYDILRVKKLLTQQDLGEITQMQKKGATSNDILKYVEDRVKMQREGAKEKEKKRAFERILNECYEKIPQYLKKFLPKYANKLNLLPDANRIHLVGEYDYLSIAGPGSSGVFRSESGDIYISQKAIEQFENAPALGSIDKGGNQVSTFPRIYWEIKHIMVHEMLHSMSILNYKDNNNENESLMRHIGTRRLGLLNINYKNGKMRGYGMNEGTTEWLAQFILENRYHDEGLLNYKAPRVAYEQEQNIISKIIKIDGDDIKREDFYKAMLLRKYGDEKKVEFKTPLFELVGKINGRIGRKAGEKKISDKRPHYYQLVMSLLDYVNDKNLNNVNFILEFIEKKDISILKNHFGSALNTVFDNTLLNKSKTDFNKTILDGYSGKIK